MTRILMLLTKLLNINSTGVFLCKGTLTSNICVSIWISQFSKISVSDPDSLNPDLDPEDLLSSDSGPGYCWIWIQSGSGSKQRFFITFFFPKPSYIFLLQRTFKLWETLQTKREHFKHEIFLFFFFFGTILACLGPDSDLDPLIHMIRIRNTCLRALTVLQCCKISLVEPGLNSQIKYTCIYLKCLFNGKDILMQQAWKYNKILI